MYLSVTTGSTAILFQFDVYPRSVFECLHENMMDFSTFHFVSDPIQRTKLNYKVTVDS